MFLLKRITQGGNRSRANLARKTEKKINTEQESTKLFPILTELLLWWRKNASSARAAAEGTEAQNTKSNNVISNIQIYTTRYTQYIQQPKTTTQFINVFVRHVYSTYVCA